MLGVRAGRQATCGEIVKCGICDHLAIAYGIKQRLDQASRNFIEFFITLWGVGGASEVLCTPVSVLYGSVHDLLAVCLYDSNRLAESRTEKDFRDPPERILHPLCRRARGVVKGEGKVVVGMHLHLPKQSASAMAGSGGSIRCRPACPSAGW